MLTFANTFGRKFLFAIEYSIRTVDIQNPSREAPMPSRQESRPTTSGQNVQPSCCCMVADGQKSILCKIDINILQAVQPGDTEIIEYVNAAAGQNGTANGLFGVFDREVAFFHHLRNGFKPEVRGDQQCHTDDPARDAVHRIQSRGKDVSKVGNVPMAGEQEDKAGDDGNGNIAEQHDRLRFYQELYVLNAHQEVQNQQAPLRSRQWAKHPGSG